MSRLNYIILGVLVVIAVVVVTFLATRQRYPKPQLGEVMPAGEMKKKYGLTIEQYTPPRLDPARVPENLRDLLPLAQKWGISDDIIRGDLQQKASEEEKKRFQELYNHRIREVGRWLDSFDGKQMSDEAAAFLYMAEAYDEMRLFTPDLPHEK